MAVADTPQTRLHDEHQYLNLIRDVLGTGDLRPDRTGTGTLSIFAPPNLRFSLADSESTLPLLATKRTFLRGIVEELIWFVRGCTDAKQLSAKGGEDLGWDGMGFGTGRGIRSSSRSAGWATGARASWALCTALPMAAFRRTEYEDCDAGADYTGKGVDQLQECNA